MNQPKSPRLATEKTSRRAVLKAAAGTTAGLALIGRAPLASAAAEATPIPKASLYPAKAFAQTKPDAALKLLYGQSDAPESGNVKMTAPDIAENGAVVPISLDANMAGVTSSALLAIDNPYSLACAYEIPAGTNVGIASRLKLAKTTKVVGVVKAGGKLASTSKSVKVTLGGCG